MTATHDPVGQGPPTLNDGLSGAQAQALAGLIGAAQTVQRRHQFFVWSQTQLQPLVAHQLLVCAAYQRPQRGLAFDVFNNVVLSRELLTGLSEPHSALLLLLVEHWVQGRGRPRLLQLDPGLAGPAAGLVQRLHAELGSGQLLVHGVSRPQRREEVESLFILGGLSTAGAGPSAVPADAAHTAWLDLLMPYLHSVWLRVVHNESERPREGATLVLNRGVPPPARGPRPTITAREVQILRWVQQGCSNQQIAELLLISPLTVKNHVQKILRKLDANNRTQAVARAIALGALQLNPYTSPDRPGMEGRPAPLPPAWSDPDDSHGPDGPG